MYILGINAVFHDSAACILKDGVLLAAAEEERFTHIKHGKRPIPFSTYELPYHAIDYCLKVAGIHLREVDHIAYSFNPELMLESATIKSTDTFKYNSNAPLNVKAVYGNWDPLFYTLIKSAPSQLTGGYPHHLEKDLQLLPQMILAGILLIIILHMLQVHFMLHLLIKLRL